MGVGEGAAPSGWGVRGDTLDLVRGHQWRELQGLHQAKVIGAP